MRSVSKQLRDLRRMLSHRFWLLVFFHQVLTNMDDYQDFIRRVKNCIKQARVYKPRWSHLDTMKDQAQIMVFQK